MNRDLLKGAAAAADVTGLKRREIYYLVDRGQVPVRRVGRHLYFSRTALLEALLPITETVAGGAA